MFVLFAFKRGEDGEPLDLDLGRPFVSAGQRSRPVTIAVRGVVLFTSASRRDHEY